MTLFAASFPALRWQERAPLLTPLAGGYAFQSDAGAVYAGGTTWQEGVKQFRTDVQFYDQPTNQWSAGPSLPLAVGYGANVATSDGFEILGGTKGSQTSRQTWRMSRSDRQWHEAEPLPFDTLLSRAEAVDDQVFVFGGCSDIADLTGCSDAVMLRNHDGKWTRISTQPQGTMALAASAVAEKSVYLFGGCTMLNKTAVNHDDAWEFDTTARAWHRLRKLPKPVRGSAAIALGGKHILIVGGYADNGFVSDALIYDIKADRYQPAASLPINAANVALIRLGDGILAMGGEDRMRSRTPRVFIGTPER